jgi:hypothetical protein
VDTLNPNHGWERRGENVIYKLEKRYFTYLQEENAIGDTEIL